MTEALIDNIATAIVETLGGAVTGIRTAVDPPPPKLDTAQLPALFAFTGGATDDEEAIGEGFVLVARSFRVQVAVLPTGQGDPQTRETLVRPLIGRVKSAYRSHKNLSGVAWIQDVRVLGDSGVVILPEYGGAFIGFEVRLEVRCVERRQILD